MSHFQTVDVLNPKFALATQLSGIVSVFDICLNMDIYICNGNIATQKDAMYILLCTLAGVM